MKIWFLALVLWLMAAPVDALTYWVRQTGTMAGCTASTTAPVANSGWKSTIVAGIGCLSSGDTLMIENGIYNEMIGPTTALPPSGKVGAPTTIKAITPRAVVLRSTTLNQGKILWNYQRDYVTYDGLWVDGSVAGSGTTDIVTIYNDVGGTGPGGSNTGVIFQNGECSWSVNNSCISANGTGTKILNTSIHDFGGSLSTLSPKGAHGIYLSVPSDGTIIDGNDVGLCTSGGNTCFGIQAYHTGMNNITVSNNYVHDNQGITVSGGDIFKVFGNKVSRTIYGLNLAADSVSVASNVSFYNNTVYGGTDCGSIGTFGSPTGTTYKNNLCLSNTNNTFTNTAGRPLTLSNNLSSTNNGILVDPANGNFNIASAGISLVDAGTASITGTIILQKCPASAPCFNGANPDIGAVESGAVVVALPVVQWINDRGGGGTATGTTNWQAPGIPLRVGINNITVTATDTSGGTATDTQGITYVPTFPGNTLAGAWGFEETSGNATDSSDNKNTGVLVNGPTRTAQGHGSTRAITFNGTTQYVRVSGSNSLDFTQGFALSAWVKPAAPLTTWETIVVKNYNILLSASSDGICGNGAPLVWFQSNGGFFGSTDNHYACFPTPLAVGVWSFVAGTYDGTSLKLYINSSTPVATTPVSPQAYIEPTNLDLTIGAAVDATSTFAYFNGDIDEVRVYNFAIPVNAGANSSYGAACGYTNYTQSVKSSVNYSLASIIGDANCGVIQTVITTPVKVPASATGVKAAAAAGAVKFAPQ